MTKTYIVEIHAGVGNWIAGKRAVQGISELEVVSTDSVGGVERQIDCHVAAEDMAKASILALTYLKDSLGMLATEVWVESVTEIS